jgi:hypothetical protein
MSFDPPQTTTTMVETRTSLEKAEGADSESPFDTLMLDLDEGDESNAFSTKPKDAEEEEDDGFDPFKIASTAKAKIFKRGSKSTKAPTTSVSSVLPPRLEVKFRVQEEITSGPSLANLSEGACDVYVSGTVLVRKRLEHLMDDACLYKMYTCTRLID